MLQTKILNSFLISEIEGAVCNVITVHPGAYELESLKNEIERNEIDAGYFTEENYPFTIKPNFSTLGIIRENEPGRG